MLDVIQSSTIRADYVTIAVTFFILWVILTLWITTIVVKSINFNK